MGKVSQAQARAIAKYEKNNYDRVLVRFPKGTKERIQATGQSLNSFTINAVMDKLQAIESKTE